jgi:hypothetical protein
MVMDRNRSLPALFVGGLFLSLAGVSALAGPGRPAPRAGGSAPVMRLVAAPDCTTGLAGSVYIDYNANGIREANETDGQPNLTVSVTDAAGQVLTALTDAGGRYEFGQVLTYPVRLSFGGLPGGLLSTLRGANNGTTVQFIDAPGCGYDLALNQPQDYCQANPFLLTACFVGADLPAAPAVVSFRSSEVNRPAQPFNQPNGSQFVRAPLMTERALTNQQQTGSVHGLAWHRSGQTAFAGAFARIGARLPDGPGAIYSLTNTGSVSATVGLFVTVPNAGSGSVAAGDVGKKGLGNLELSADQQTLYTINLNARTVVSIALGDTAPGSLSLTAGAVSQTPIPAPTDCLTDFRPFALRQHNGKLYVGVTCGSADPASLKAYVYEFDGSAFTLRLTVPFVYDRANVNANFYGYPGYPTYIDNNMNFIGWETFPPTNVYEFEASPKTQPWLTDIAFDRDDMILGIRSRLADATVNSFWTIGGEVLRACATGPSAWSLENNGVCGTKTTGTPPVVNPFTGAANLRSGSKGPGGYEYYWGDDGFEGEASQGSLLQIPGQPQVFVSQANALGHNGQIGVMALNNTTGATTAAGNVFYGDFDEGNYIAKANGLGALAALCDPAPLQIGNRVWLDRNQNGYQDPGEPAVPGVTVTLFDNVGTTALATSITNAGGEFFFASAPATVGSTTTALTPDTGFRIVITDLGSSPVVINNNLTISRISPQTPGETGGPNPGRTPVNNDAVLLNGRPTIRLTTGGRGSVNHTYDFGLISDCQPACVPITSRRLY